MDFDLSVRRARNDQKLKSIFERIFEKYEKDFTDIGDEIDLVTEQIVVNNGHLQSLADEKDAGSLIEIDDLCLEETDGVSSRISSISPPVSRRKAAITQPCLRDVDLPISPAPNISLHASARSLQVNSSTTKSRDCPSGPLVRSPSALTEPTSPHAPIDATLEPKWRAPPLPNNGNALEKHFLDDALEPLEYEILAPSPPRDSLWTSLVPHQRKARKRMVSDTGGPDTPVKRRRALACTKPRDDETRLLRTNHSRPPITHADSQTRKESFPSTPLALDGSGSFERPLAHTRRERKTWSPAEEERLMTLKLGSLHGENLYCTAFPGRGYRAITFHWHWLKTYHPEKLRGYKPQVIPEHLRSLSCRSSRFNAQAHQSQDFKANTSVRRDPTDGSEQIGGNPIREGVESSAMAVGQDDTGHSDLADQDLVPSALEHSDNIQNHHSMNHEAVAQVGKRVIPDSQEDEDIPVSIAPASDTVSNDTHNETHSLPAAEDSQECINRAVTEDRVPTCQPSVMLPPVSRPMLDTEDVTEATIENGSLLNPLPAENECLIETNAQLELTIPEPSDTLQRAGSPPQENRDLRSRTPVRATLSPLNEALPLESVVILDDSSATLGSKSTVTETCSTAGKRQSPVRVDISEIIVISDDEDDAEVSQAQARKPRKKRASHTRFPIPSSSKKIPLRPQKSSSLLTPRKISLVPRLAWKKPSTPSGVPLQASDDDSEDELFTRLAEKPVTPRSTIKATMSEGWAQMLCDRRRTIH